LADLHAAAELQAFIVACHMETAGNGLFVIELFNRDEVFRI